MGELFLKLLHMSLSASVLVLAVLVLRLVLHRAPKWTHVLLWALVALRLLCPLTPESPLSLQPSAISETALSGIADGVPGPSYAYWDGTGDADMQAHYDAAVEAGLVPVNGGLSGKRYVVTGADGISPPPRSFRDSAARVWLAGVGAMLLYALVSYLRLRRRVAASLPLEDNVFVCDGIDSPFILGVFRPHVYVPSGLAEPQLSHVLSHERAHLARRDHWWKPLGFLLLSVYWFNPVLWLAYVLLCRDIELACDERVYRDMALPARADYSQTLLDQSRSRHALSACPLAFGEVGTKDRVRAALSYKKPAFWVIVLALIACAVAAVCFLTDPRGLKIEFTRGDILGAETYHALTVEDEGIHSLNVNQIDALYDRLQDLPRITRPGDNAGHTPMYELTVSLGSGENEDHLVLRGYNTEGTMTEVAYRGKTWLVTDDDFGPYVMHLCAGADTEPATEVIRWSADLDGDGEMEYFVLDASTLDSLGYAQFWLEDADGSKINEPGEVSTSHTGWGTLALTELDGKTYLMEYNPSMFQGEASYTYTLMELKDYGLSPVEHRELTFSANPGKSESNDTQAMKEFQDRANELWAHSRLLVTTDQAVLTNLHNVRTRKVPDSGKGYYISPVDETVQYREVLIVPDSVLVVQYDPEVLSLTDLNALGEKYGFEAVKNFGRNDLFSANFPEPLTVVAANEYIELLPSEPGILRAALAEYALSVAASAAMSRQLQDAWAAWDAMAPETQMLQSSLPRSQGRQFDTWADAVNFLGYAPWNPLEGAAWLTHANYTGAPIPAEDGVLKHAYLSWQGDRTGAVDAVTLWAGYADGDVRVVLIAQPLGWIEPDLSGAEWRNLNGFGAYCVHSRFERGDAADLYFTRDDIIHYTVRVTSFDGAAALQQTLERVCSALGGAALWADFTSPTMLGRNRADVADLTLPAFPDVTFRCSTGELTAVTATGEEALIQGMPISNVFLADLTGDGRPEFCATVCFGSGLIDEHIVVYDYAADKSYWLWDRGNYDYRLRLDDGMLIAVRTPHDGRSEAVSGQLLLRDGDLEIAGFDEVPFTGVMGLDGSYRNVSYQGSWHVRRYQIADEFGNPITTIAESFGFTIDDHVVDLDGDGVTELVCNCVYGGDGAQRVLVYRRSGSTIQRGSIDYAKVNLTAWDNWGANSTAERYNPELGVFLVKYASLASSSGDGTTSGKFLREVDYSAFAWENYAVVP